MADCIFCRIVAGEVPSEKIAESERLCAFLDISPVNEGHVLIVPKAHHENLLDFPAGLAQEVVELAQRIGRAQIEETDAEGFNLIINNGPAAGQVVMHAHFHVIPRKEGDGKLYWKGQSDGDLAAVAQKLRSAL